MIKTRLTSFLNEGASTRKSGEENRKVFIVNLFGLVGLSITSVMTVFSLFHLDYALAAALAISAVVYYLSHYIQRVTGNTYAASMLILYSLLMLMIYLVYGGGYKNTGPLWIFMVAPVTLFLLGLKKGAVYIGLFVFVITIMLFYPQDALLTANYSFEFKTRLLFSFLTIAFLSGLYEYSQQKSFEQVMRLSKEYEQMAKCDSLTHLPNRREALDQLGYAMNRLSRNKESICVILCDVDNFKSINDNYGHLVGDKTLVCLAKLFNDQVRQQDCVARWGGEEFLFVLPDTTLNQAKAFSQKIHSALNQLSIDAGTQKLTVTISMGISEILEGQAIEQVLSIADDHMYKAKTAGRNQTYPS